MESNYRKERNNIHIATSKFVVMYVLCSRARVGVQVCVCIVSMVFDI